MTTSTAPTTEERELLDMLRINVRHWRKTSNLSFRFMPQSLWDEVLSSAQMFGARKVATIVGVNITDLNRRIKDIRYGLDTRAPPPPPAEPAPLEVIELPGVALAQPRTQVTDDEAVIEVASIDGATLTVRVAVAHLNIPALVQQFRTRA